VCVCILSLVNRHANRMSRIIVIRGLSVSTLFFHIISQTALFTEKNY
jgi:hypothetical protein